MKTKLKNSQIEQLIRLNRRLAEIEHGIRQRVESMRSALDNDLASPHSWLEDYEFENVIDFIMRQDDPSWVDENDNIIASWTLEDFKTNDGKHRSFQTYLDFSFIGDNIDHCTCVDSRLRTEPHCWLFHVLYDDLHIPWENMLQIGSVWIDLKVTHQREEKIY